MERAGVRRIVTGAYETARNIVLNNREILERIAMALLDREVLDANELKLLMAGKPLPENTDGVLRERADTFRANLKPLVPMTADTNVPNKEQSSKEGN